MTALDILVHGQGLTQMGLLVILLHLAGVGLAVHAVFHARTPQGSIAWAISLVEFPYLAVPLYLLIGWPRFKGYIRARRRGRRAINKLAAEVVENLSAFAVPATHEAAERMRSLERLAGMPFTRGNRVRLLVDGPATFDAIFEAIEAARHYILVQFFIVKDDEIGRELQARLVRKALEGVRVCFLYDLVGGYALTARYVAALREAGVQVESFRASVGRRRWVRLQINFRNHRKIVVVDGHTAFVGGLNVGDEYMGRSPRFGPWRDTHARIEGPAVQAVQLAFVEDWCWASGAIPPLTWTPATAPGGDQAVAVVPGGPADEIAATGFMFLQAIHAARRRIWIASPYFVPDEGVFDALRLAALRGVDVRVLLPLKPDHLMVYLSSYSYLEDADAAGLRLYRYRPGFMHQKVFVVDNDLAGVGTANLDSRSFRLNFEVTAVVADRAFAEETEAMLARDFSHAVRIGAHDYRRRSFPFRLAVRVARLMAPLQ